MSHQIRFPALSRARIIPRRPRACQEKKTHPWTAEGKLAGALAALGSLGSSDVGLAARSASDTAAGAYRYLEQAAARADAPGYETALSVLRDSARELAALGSSGALPSARAAEAAEIVDTRRVGAAGKENTRAIIDTG